MTEKTPNLNLLRWRFKRGNGRVQPTPKAGEEKGQWDGVYAYRQERTHIPNREGRAERVNSALFYLFISFKAFDEVPPTLEEQYALLGPPVQMLLSPQSPSWAYPA